MNHFEEILISEKEEGKRLDFFLAKKMPERFSRSQIQKRIKEEGIKVDGKAVVPHYHIKSGEKIQIEVLERAPDVTRAEELPLEIVYEDEDCLVVNKAVGMVVHPAHGNLQHTLVNALLFHTQKLSRVGDKVRPGIVHRLDKDTSGLLVVAKNDHAHHVLARQFERHTIERVYHAVVRGVVQHDEGICEEPVGRAFLNRKKVIIKPSGGKDAITYFKVLKRFSKASLVEIRPKTGRTHQIRVHFAHMGHPALGDTLYGVRHPQINRQALHASAIGFHQPRTNEWIFLESKLPGDIQRLLSFLETQS